jgi:ribosomal protein L11 methyltransferase
MPEEVVVRLDPGMAFGTGTHPTTQLCLAALERYVQPGASVLDLGTGSGILAIAAAKLGARPVLGLDIDAEAVRAARENVDANGVGDAVSVELGSLREVIDIGDLRFEIRGWGLVVANILSSIIVRLLDEGLARVVAPGGPLILSGILETQAEEVEQAARQAGLLVSERTQLGDWVAVVARKAEIGD